MGSQKRPLFIGRIIISFIIASLIFIAGFLVSYSIVYYKYQDVAISQSDIKTGILKLEIQKDLFFDSCDLEDVYAYGEELSNVGGFISVLEEKFGKIDSQVLGQKKIHTMLEVQHFLLVKNYQERCNQNISNILFFYSNNEAFVEMAEKMGYILSSFKEKNPEVMIYSFDYDLDDSLMNILKKKYNVTSPNRVIINEDIFLSNILNIDDLDVIFDEINNISLDEGFKENLICDTNSSISI